MEGSGRIAPVLLMGFALLLGSCGGGALWEDRGILRDIQEPAGDRKAGKRTPPPPSKSIPEVGVCLPLSGRLASYGKAVLDGLNLAMDLHGEGKVRLVVMDSKGTEEGTREVFRTLAERRTLLAVIGPCTSRNARVASRIAEEARLPMVTPTATAFDITKDRNYIFRTCFTDPLQGAAMAIFTRRRLEIRSVGFIVCKDEDYSRSLADQFEKAFSAMGGDITFLNWFGPDLDVVAPAKALLAAPHPPDAVFIPAYFEESARFAREARRLGYEGKFLGGDGWHSDAFFKIGGPAVAGSYFSTHFIDDDPDPVTRRFVKDFEERMKRKPGTFAALGYDAGMAFLHVLAGDWGAGREGFREAFSKIEDLEGVTGAITLDEAGNTIKDAVIAQVTEEGLRFKERIRFVSGIR